MSNRRSIPAKEVVGDSETFINFMRKLIAVPHSEIKAELEAEKAWKHWPFSSSPDPGESSKKR